MGYNIYLTRAADWSQNQDAIIRIDEWRQVASTDSSLNHDPYDEGTFDWSAHPSGTPVPFHYSDGNVTVKNPDDAILGKALELAHRMRARVQGDDGEIYEKVGAAPRHDAGRSGHDVVPLRDGRWQGRYRYDVGVALLQKLMDFLVSHAFTMWLSHSGPAVSGTIADGASRAGTYFGNADVSGEYDASTGFIRFRKTYRQQRYQSDLIYEGTVRGDQMSGKWTLRKNNLQGTGTWEATWTAER